MSDVVSALLLASVSIAAIFALKTYMRLCAEMKIQYGEAVRQFYDAAKPLISDEETPDSLRDTIKAMSDTIDDNLTVIALYKIVAKRSIQFNRSMPEHVKESHEFFARRPELESQFDLSVLSWFTAITALRPLYGSFVRVATYNHNEQMYGLARKTIADTNAKRHDNEVRKDLAAAGC
tara:strand:- start:4159 stop:4692 length:534 start_codon:yes stop_codon:yes gene_type:complete